MELLSARSRKAVGRRPGRPVALDQGGKHYRDLGHPGRGQRCRPPEIPDATLPDPPNPQPRASHSDANKVPAMPKLVFPVLPDGLRVDVVIGLDRATIDSQIAAGQPITAPISTLGEVDTGSNITAVNAALIRRLGVPRQYQTTTKTAAGG